MTVTTDAFVDICASRLTGVAVDVLAPLAGTPSQVRESIPSVAGTGLAKHSPKRFAMAGIYTNVWPLGPQERTSG